MDEPLRAAVDALRERERVRRALIQEAVVAIERERTVFAAQRIVFGAMRAKLPDGSSPDA